MNVGLNDVIKEYEKRKRIAKNYRNPYLKRYYCTKTLRTLLLGVEGT